MTEAEWLAISNPTAMLEEVELTSERKLQLFSVACCRRVWEYLAGAGTQQAVEVAERYADGLATLEQLDAARIQAEPFKSLDYGDVHIAWYVAKHPSNASSCVLFTSLLYAESLVPPEKDVSEKERRDEADSEESAAQADLLRDIFGNPFRPITLNPSWLTSTVLALAKGIYEEKAFDRMAILADALQDAGCDNQDILNHCRQPGEHVRGCWVVDLVTDRK